MEISFGRQAEVISAIQKELKPIGAIWNGHPVLLRAASRSVLQNLPLKRIQQMCRDLNTNVEGLIELLEKRNII